MGKIITRKRGKVWEYSFEIKTTDNKRKRKSKSGFKTKAEALEAGTIAQSEYINKPKDILNFKDILFKDFVKEWWELYIEPFYKYNSKRNFKTTINHRLLPYFSDYQISKIDKILLNKYLIENSSIYSKIVLNRDIILLNNIFKIAVENYGLQINPVIGLKIPQNCKEVAKSTRKALTIDEINHIKANAPEHISFLIDLFINTGMRRGEALALIWEDIDFENNIIHIRRNITHTNNLHFYIDTPKTKTSLRDIYITEAFKNILKEKKKKTNHFYFEKVTRNNITYFAPSSSGSEFVATDFKGMPISVAQITFFLKKLGINCHSLRHTYTTLLIEGGANIKTVQEQLGHSNANITLSVYAHNTNNMRKEALDILDKKLSTIN